MWLEPLLRCVACRAWLCSGPLADWKRPPARQRPPPNQQVAQIEALRRWMQVLAAGCFLSGAKLPLLFGCSFAGWESGCNSLFGFRITECTCNFTFLHSNIKLRYLTTIEDVFSSIFHRSIVFEFNLMQICGSKVFGLKRMLDSLPNQLYTLKLPNDEERHLCFDMLSIYFEYAFSIRCIGIENA